MRGGCGCEAEEEEVDLACGEEDFCEGGQGEGEGVWALV